MGTIHLMTLSKGVHKRWKIELDREKKEPNGIFFLLDWFDFNFQFYKLEKVGLD